MRCVVLVVVLSVAALTVYGDTCASHVNGCSIPFGMDFLHKSLFTPACNRHDVCYGCGALYGLDREACDSAFLVDMKAACTSAKRRRLVDKRNPSCETTATDVYYTAVRLFGGPNYHHAGHTQHFCTQSWVRSCLP